jgi:hypothetical protein
MSHRSAEVPERSDLLCAIVPDLPSAERQFSVGRMSKNRQKRPAGASPAKGRRESTSKACGEARIVAGSMPVVVAAKNQANRS